MAVIPKKTLSSASTFLAKFVFPTVWISGFAVGTVSLWLDAFHGRDSAPPPPQMKFIFLGVWVLGSIFLWAHAGLKRVRLDERQLYISNYLREISLPFRAISDVKQNRWLNSRPITIYFNEATEFGDKATFIPKWRMRVKFWQVDSVVNELKRLARSMR